MCVFVCVCVCECYCCYRYIYISQQHISKIQLKMLDGSLIFEEYSRKWSKYTKKCPKPREDKHFS